MQIADGAKKSIRSWLHLWSSTIFHRPAKKWFGLWSRCRYFQDSIRGAQGQPDLEANFLENRRLTCLWLVSYNANKCHDCVYKASAWGGQWQCCHGCLQSWLVIEIGKKALMEPISVLMSSNANPTAMRWFLKPSATQLVVVRKAAVLADMKELRWLQAHDGAKITSLNPEIITDLFRGDIALSTSVSGNLPNQVHYR